YYGKMQKERVEVGAMQSAGELAPWGSVRRDNRLVLKREDMQAVFSFKLRGAYNKMAHLAPADRERGVIAASAGNHAQGVALAAHRLGRTARIVMPGTPPRIKSEPGHRMGAPRTLTGGA